MLCGRGVKNIHLVTHGYLQQSRVDLSETIFIAAGKGIKSGFLPFRIWRLLIEGPDYR